MLSRPKAGSEEEDGGVDRHEGRCTLPISSSEAGPTPGPASDASWRELRELGWPHDSTLSVPGSKEEV
eukprot:941200-Rhodomonas_salina.1